MSEQETVQTEELEETSEQSLAESVNELESLTQQALEMDGEAREQLVEQIKTKCEAEGLSSAEAEALLEEIGLVQEARKVKESKKTKATESTKSKKEEFPPKKDDDDKDDSDDSDDDDDEDKEDDVEEAKVILPKTKSAAMNQVFEKLGKLRKADIMANYEKIMSTLDLKEESDVADNKPLDIEDDINALVEGEELTPAFREKASTIFEAAVQAKVNQVLIEKQVKIEEENEQVIQEQVAEYKTELVDQVNSYINYVAEQWLEDNRLAVEKGIRTEITEGFIKGMKNLFNEHYITIPEDKVDVVDDLFAKVEELEKQLNEEMQKGVNLNQDLNKFKKEKVIQSVTSGLSDTQTEKVKELAEGVEEDNVESFEKKVEVIKENYFPTKNSNSTTQDLVEEVINDDQDNKTEVATGSVMNHYLTALTKQSR